MEDLGKVLPTKAVNLVTDTASTSFNKHNCHPGMYLACVYDNEWYIGIVREISEDSDDIFIKFTKQDGVNFMWPIEEDECWVSFVNVLAQVNSLVAQGHGARTYRVSENELQYVSETFLDMWGFIGFVRKIQVLTLKTRFSCGKEHEFCDFLRNLICKFR